MANDPTMCVPMMRHCHNVRVFDGILLCLQTDIQAVAVSSTARAEIRNVPYEMVEEKQLSGDSVKVSLIHALISDKI